MYVIIDDRRVCLEKIKGQRWVLYPYGSGGRLLGFGGVTWLIFKSQEYLDVGWCNSFLYGVISEVKVDGVQSYKVYRGHEVPFSEMLIDREFSTLEEAIQFQEERLNLDFPVS